MAGKRRRARGSKKHGDANENSPSTLDVIHGDAVPPDGNTEEDAYRNSQVHEEIHEEHDEDVPKDVGEELPDQSDDNENKTPNDHVDDSPEIEVQEERASKESGDVNEETTNTHVEHETLNNPVEVSPEDTEVGVKSALPSKPGVASSDAVLPNPTTEEEYLAESPPSLMKDNISALNKETAKTQGSQDVENKTLNDPVEDWF